MSIFSSVKAIRPKRTLFDLSNHYLGTGVAGELYPVMCQEVVPGLS